jgi:hypothetical protein
MIRWRDLEKLRIAGAREARYAAIATPEFTGTVRAGLGRVPCCAMQFARLIPVCPV